MLTKWLRGILAVFAGLLIAAGLTIPSINWIHSHVRSARVIHRSRLQPIILMPGSSANQNRFNTLFNELTQNTRGHSLLKVTVSPSGSMRMSGRLAPRDTEPYIVIAFTDNKDGYPTIKKQAKWFDLAFTMLAKRFHFDRFSGIGHSNGGLVLTLFLEKYMNQNDYTMRNLMTIGSPFNLEESNRANRTQMLSDMIRARHKLPTNLNVYSVAGSENYNGDGIVPLASVEAGKYVFQNQVAHYTLTTVSGDKAGHSDLPQNKQIVQLIRQDILITPDRGTPQP